MPNITTCTRCGRLFEAGSEEAANDPRERLCRECLQRGQLEGTRDDAEDLTLCAACGIATEGHVKRCPECGSEVGLQQTYGWEVIEGGPSELSHVDRPASELPPRRRGRDLTYLEIALAVLCAAFIFYLGFMAGRGAVELP